MPHDIARDPRNPVAPNAIAQRTASTLSATAPGLLAGLSGPGGPPDLPSGFGGSGSAGADNLLLTGHSLGGCLAGTASAATDLPAVTFNAAGVHPNTVIGDGILPNALGTQIALDPARGPEIDVSPWDLANPVGLVVDTAIDIGRYSVDEHGTPSVLEAMEASDYVGRH